MAMVLFLFSDFFYIFIFTKKTILSILGLYFFISLILIPQAFFYLEINFNFRTIQTWEWYQRAYILYEIELLSYLFSFWYCWILLTQGILGLRLPKFKLGKISISNKIYSEKL